MAATTCLPVEPLHPAGAASRDPGLSRYLWWLFPLVSFHVSEKQPAATILPNIWRRKSAAIVEPRSEESPGAEKATARTVKAWKAFTRPTLFGGLAKLHRVAAEGGWGKGGGAPACTAAENSSCWQSFRCGRTNLQLFKKLDTGASYKPGYWFWMTNRINWISLTKKTTKL